MDQLASFFFFTQNLPRVTTKENAKKDKEKEFGHNINVTVVLSYATN